MRVSKNLETKILAMSDSTMTPSKRPSKYRNKQTVVDGVTFASKREADRWIFLRHLQLTGVIKNLERQVRFPLIVRGRKVCVYVCDFRYTDVKTSAVVVEDSKGFKTPEYKLKKRLMLAVHGIKIQEV